MQKLTAVFVLGLGVGLGIVIAAGIAGSGIARAQAEKQGEGIVEYRLVSATESASRVQDDVNSAIHDGWEPLGSVAVARCENGTTYAQTMVKRRK
jgi:hypothetical protein